MNRLILLLAGAVLIVLVGFAGCVLFFTTLEVEQAVGYEIAPGEIVMVPAPGDASAVTVRDYGVEYFAPGDDPADVARLLRDRLAEQGWTRAEGDGRTTTYVKQGRELLVDVRPREGRIQVVVSAGPPA